MSQLKVSIINQFYPPDYAATGQLIEELAHQLSNQNIKIQILTGQPGYHYSDFALPRETKQLISIRRSLTSRFWPINWIGARAINGLVFSLISGLRLLKRSYRGDVILVTTEPPFIPIIGYFVNKLFNCPYVCLIYDLYPDIAVQLNILSKHNWLTKIWNWINCQIWRNAKQVIVLSPNMKQYLTKKYPEIANKVTVIHNWANPNQIVPKPKSDNPFAIKNDLVEPFTVLYSGNMGRCHDFETITAAAWELRNEPVKFLFIGRGAKFDDCYNKVINQWQLTNCLFLPFQNKKDLPNTLTACDLSLVTVSQGMEELVAPSKLYGILAAGRPVAAICSSNCYLTELLQDANCGKSFTNGDSMGLANYIRFLAANPSQVQTMGKAARNYLETNFTSEEIAKQYANVFYNAASKNYIPTLSNPPVVNSK